MKKPTNDKEALIMALVLGITAPTDEQYQKAQDLAEQLAARMTDEDISWCKKQALRELQLGATHA